VPRQPTPVVPLPVVHKPKTTTLPAPATETGSAPTDRSPRLELPRTSTERDFPPMPPDGENEPAIGPHVPAEIPPPASPAPPQVASPPLPAATTTRSGGMRASEIMAAIPTEDWTMTPDAAAPTVRPASPAKGSPSGDSWVPPGSRAHDGWSSPSKAEQAHIPSTTNTPPTGNPDHAVAEKARDVVDLGDMPTHLGDNIEIDPSLIDGDHAKAEPHDSPRPTFAPAARHSEAPRSGGVPPPPPIAIAPDRPPRNNVDMTNSTGWFRDSQEIPRFPSEHDPEHASPRRRRMLIIALVAGIATIAVAVALVMVIGNTGKDTPAASSSAAQGSSGLASADQTRASRPGAGSDAPSVSASGSGSQVANEPEKSGKCSLDLTSVPPGAQIVLDDNTIVGTTPATVEVPCGVESKFTLKKARYTPTTKSVTATGENTKVDAVKLGRAQFLVKVTSAPSGASIAVGGRPMGVTPTTIKLPAYETSRITLTKDGFATETEPFLPKVNGAPLHVILKKGTSRHHP
jgi:hypothetical protein